MKRAVSERLFIKDFLSWNMSDIENLPDFNRYFESLIDWYEQKKEIFFCEESKNEMRRYLEIKATRKFIKDLQQHLFELKNKQWEMKNNGI